MRHSEVLMFCSGLMKDPRPLVEHVYQMYIERQLNVTRTGEKDEEAERQLEAQGKSDRDSSLFRSLYTESTVPIPGQPLHNKYINIYNHDDTPRDTTPITTASQWYGFYNMDKAVEYKITGEVEIPECSMTIDSSSPAVTKSLMSTCREISHRQTVTDLFMSSVKIDGFIEPVRLSSNVQSVILRECILPPEHLATLLHQCGTTLQCLRLWDMNLQPVEKELDELLQVLLSHHQEGRAHGKLMLGLSGDKIKTNLSRGFVNKWRGRCENIKSIYCVIES